MAKRGFQVFDSDMHVLEPPDLPCGMARVEKERVQIEFDRMDRDHTKRRPRPWFPWSPVP